MKARIAKTKITFRDIWNESQMECVTLPARQVGCKTENKEFGTVIVVTGTTAQLEAFIDKYNAQF